MTKLVAVIRPDRREAVEAALERQGAQILANAAVSGPRWPRQGTYRGFRLEVLIRDDGQVHRAVEAIARLAAEGDGNRLGDGSIVITPIVEPGVLRAAGAV
jgi:nitrogen regulatory protein PII